MKQKRLNTIGRAGFLCLVMTALFAMPLAAGEQSAATAAETVELPETVAYSTSLFRLQLLEETQTAAALSPAKDEGFDFTTGEWLSQRAGAGFYHLGDVTLRWRKGFEKEWQGFSSASRHARVAPLKEGAGQVLAAAELTSGADPEMPLRVVRYWEEVADRLVLRFALTNVSDEQVEIGALGIPMVFNNILHHKHLDEVHAENVFSDPYIGMDAGYVQVVRLSGEGPALLVLPHQQTPFEAYRPLNDDPMPRGITFEGMHEWMVHSKAYATQEWKGVEQWNESSSKVMAPGETYAVGVAFVLAPSVREVEATLARYHRPVAVGLPGYVLPMDVAASLHLKFGTAVKALQVTPKDALSVEPMKNSAAGYQSYSVKGLKWGRTRLLITYEDGTRQTIHYKVIKPEAEVVSDNGHFLTTKQWFDSKEDPFGRSPSVMTYDYEAGRIADQDQRVWISGLSDEGGAGGWLNAIMKQLVQPDAEEVAKMERFVHETMWGGIQYSDGPYKYGVKKSLFYYAPDSLPVGTYRTDVDFSTWAAWKKKEADSPGRSYNYPHVTAAYWVLYRLARNYEGLVSEATWQWHLEMAANTAIAMTEHAPYYAKFGQMEGSVFLLVLKDLKMEGFSQLAMKLEGLMRERAEHWASLNYPFGSEMPWDSTGQEEVYMWSKYFGFDQKATVTLNAILAYMPTLPHWGYNGSARRYWDFLYAGKRSRVERQLHHYGSALNAIPLLNQYRETPDDFYLLRVGYGGLMGAISNITQDGFAPAAFHSYPSTLEIDGISGDYGTGFYGYAVNSSTFLTHHEAFGWVAFGGNVTSTDKRLTVEVTTAGASNVYIAPLELDIRLHAGSIQQFTFDTETGAVELELAARTPTNGQAFIGLEHPDSGSAPAFAIRKAKKDARGLYFVNLKNKTQTITIQRR